MNILSASIFLFFGILSHVESRTSNCGVADVGDRIVGGDPADPNSIPWQVALMERWSVNGQLYGPFCGGTILSPYHILTAAHCIPPNLNLKLEDIVVLVGEHDTLNNQDRAVEHEIECARNHPNYDQSNTNRDFSILTLKKPIALDKSSAARAVCLPDKSDTNFVNAVTRFTVSGWGNLKSGGESPNVLHKVSVPFVSKQQCEQGYGQGSITDDMLCAGNFKNGGVDSCQGDSGGPLTWVDPTSNKVKIVGVVSNGIGCAEKNYPGIYAKVTAQLDWINQQGVATEQSYCNGIPPPPVPTTAKPAPPASTTANPAPTTARPAPTTFKPAPTTAKPAPTTAKPAPTTAKPSPSQCNTERINDGVCDDGNNIAQCFYDGNDCCKRKGRKRGRKTGRCTVCKCKKEGKCRKGGWEIADKICDDEYNTPECNYDGGDCCLKKTWYWDGLCEKCQCIQP